MEDKNKMGELFRQDDPRPYAEQAGLGDIGRTRYDVTPSVTRDQTVLLGDQRPQDMHDYNFGRALRGITQGFQPQAFDEWFDSGPSSPNVEATFNARWGALPAPKKDQGRR